MLELRYLSLIRIKKLNLTYLGLILVMILSLWRSDGGRLI